MNGAPQRVPAPSSLSYNVRPASVESSCLRVQLKVGGKFHLKLNISKRPIANKYREGKMKRTLKRECKGLEIAKREAAAGSSGAAYHAAPVSASVGFGETRPCGGCRARLRMVSLHLTRACAPSPTEVQCSPMQRKCQSPTRLETRTKESNIYASTRVSNPRCAMKVICGGRGQTRTIDRS